MDGRSFFVLLFHFSEDIIGLKKLFLSVFEESTRIPQNNIPLFLKFDINALDFKINMEFPGIIVVAP